MAKRKIIWSLEARNNRTEILEYWILRNKSKEYSIKLNSLFKEAALFVSEFPTIGKLTDDKTARLKIVRDYLMVYESFENCVVILAIFDTRRNPLRLTY